MREETRTDFGGKTQSGKASGQQNHFLRLPEELSVSIFNKVADLKSLCKCSVVSKHFASVVFRVHAVCVTIPSSRPHSVEDIKSLWTLPKPKPLVFLENFGELESIYLEYKYPENSGNSSCTKWRVKFSTNFPTVERLVALLPDSAHKQTSNEPPHQEEVNQPNDRVFSRFNWKDCLYFPYLRYVTWMCVVTILGKSHTSVKRVTVTDSEKQGKMVIGEEQLVWIRNICVCEPQEIFQLPPSAELANIPVLQLPSSGYVMKHVVFVMYECPTESRVSALDDVEYWDFEDEENVLGEAITEIYKNHSDMILIVMHVSSESQILVRDGLDPSLRLS